MSRNILKQKNKNVRVKTPSDATSRFETPLWIGVVAGVGIGMLAMYLFQSQNPPAPAGNAVANSSGTPAKDSEPAGEGAETGDRPRFDFYTLLPESEVIVPDTRESEQQPTPRPQQLPDKPQQPAASLASQTVPASPSQQSQPPREQPRLLLQAGSFKSGKEAHNRRAQLILLGLPTTLETVNPRPGETWYRVLVGPLEPGKKLADARAAMLEQGIDHVVLQRKK